MLILNHLTAVISALAHSVWYGRALNVKVKEMARYFVKSFNLGLCYAGFSQPGNVREAWMAGTSAFLCCAYDVVTDWRAFDKGARVTFESILDRLARENEIKVMAMELYKKDLTNQLEKDGLDRGAVALKLILKMMGCEELRKAAWKDLDEVGQLLQIVDDVLDYEEDLKYADTNCLISNKKDVHLRRLLNRFEEQKVQDLFASKHSILVKVIGKARIKAAKLLEFNPVSQAVRRNSQQQLK